LPGLERPAGDGLPPSRKDADNREQQVNITPSKESGATADLGSATMTEQ